MRQLDAAFALPTAPIRPMTPLTFILRGLKHYRGAYLGVLLGSALGTMVLLGALFSGDSVKATLKTVAEQRLGQTHDALIGGDNLLRAELADAFDGAAPVLHLRGRAGTSDGRSTGQVGLLGVDERFWTLAPQPMSPPPVDERAWAINRALAASLDLVPGDTLILRLRKPGLLSSDAPLSGADDEIIALRGEVARVLDDAEMGRFSLETSQLPRPAVFLPRETLAEAIEQPARANLLLFPEKIDPARLAGAATLADYGLSLVEVPKGEAIELRSERVFLAPTIESKVRASFPQATPVLTYFVNTLAANDRETPYSMVAGVVPESVDFVAEDLAADEAVIHAWQAEDLDAKAGDPLEIAYFVPRQGKLVEERATFTIREVVPLEGAVADPLWMPDFPGIAEAEDSDDWSPGMPLDLDRIRDKDETYWDDHRGTPKAFIRHDRAAELWQNRWGTATALRLDRELATLPELREELRATLAPADAGLILRDLAAEGAAAATSPVDIAMLFLSMSFFLILAAVALTAMLFRFNVEQRNRESGLLAALGVKSGRLLRWRLAEGAVIVTLGALLGTLLALAYAQGLLRFLETIWGGAGGGLFTFHAAPASIIGGILGMILLTMATIALVSRRQAKRSASLRLEAASEEVVRPGGSRAAWIAPLAAVLGLGALFAGPALGPQGAFFLAGFLFLVAGLASYRATLARGARRGLHGLPSLARLNSARRPTRSLVVVGSLAAGIFLVIAVAAFQKHGGDEWRQPDSGAGGFAFWLESSGPLDRQADGTFEIDTDPLRSLVPIRVGSGDDASCFNLNSVARPRLLGVDPANLEGRFTIKNTLEGVDPTWQALAEGDTPRAFVDETTLLWAIKRQLGDRIRYTDEAGREFEVEIAGTLADSVFQGNFLVAESRLLERYPTAAGYRLFLTESETEPDEALATLQRRLGDLGVTATPTRQRLEAFHGVENTYIAIFHVLGGLGVILGSAGLGLVTARNLSERREEFATLDTLGIPRPSLRSLVRRETARFIGWALAIGVVAALISILPTIPDTGLLPVLGSMALFILLILLTATLAAYLAITRTRWLSNASPQ